MLNAQRGFSACLLAVVLAAGALAVPTAATAADYSPTITGSAPPKRFPGKVINATAQASVPCTTWTGKAVNFRKGLEKPAGSGTTASVKFKAPRKPGHYSILFTCTYGGGKTLQTVLAFRVRKR